MLWTYADSVSLLETTTLTGLHAKIDSQHKNGGLGLAGVDRGRYARRITEIEYNSDS